MAVIVKVFWVSREDENLVLPGVMTETIYNEITKLRHKVSCCREEMPSSGFM